MSHTWMKDINHKELMEIKGYSDLSRINLKKLLVERDEVIKELREDVDALLEANKVNDKKYTHKKEVIDAQKNYTDKLSKQIHELKIEVEELREELNNMKKYFSDISKELGYGECDAEGYSDHLDKIRQLKQQNEDLTTERDHLITKLNKRNRSKSKIANRDQGLKL